MSDMSLLKLAEEATKLRDSIRPFNIDESVQDLHETLVQCRAVRDRLEQMVSLLGLKKSQAHSTAVEAQQTFQDAWDEAANSSKVGEYSSAKEREATYNAQCLVQLIAARKAKRAEDDLAGVYDFCQSKLRGVDAIRRDLDARIKMLSMIGFLEH
jgi:hypothetical protein